MSKFKTKHKNWDMISHFILFFQQRILDVAGVDNLEDTAAIKVGKAHRGICLPNHFILYFRAPGVKEDVKGSKKLQGTRIFRFGPLFFSQNERIFKNIQNSAQNCLLGQFFKVCSILAEKQRPKPKNCSSL